jgi:hypothetical protein
VQSAFKTGTVSPFYILYIHRANENASPKTREREMLVEVLRQEGKTAASSEFGKEGNMKLKRQVENP